MDRLGSDRNTAVLRFGVLPCVLVGRFEGSAIGTAGRSDYIPLNTRNVQPSSGKTQALQIISLSSNVWGREKHGRQKEFGGYSREKPAVIAMVFSIGTRALGFLTKVPLHAI